MKVITRRGSRRRRRRRVGGEWREAELQPSLRYKNVTQIKLKSDKLEISDK